MRVLTFMISRLMPFWILVFALVAFHWSSWLASWTHSTDIALGFVLFIMGLTLERHRLAQFIRRPWQPLIGSLGKWLLAPLISVLLAWLFFGLHTELANGIIMAGVVPSGTSSNLNALVAGGDLSLSVTMSAVDTLVGPILTPALSKIFAGQGVHMAYVPFVWKTARIVFLPLAAGIVLQTIVPKFHRVARPIAPILSSLALYVVVIGIVAPASSELLAHANMLLPILICVVLQILLQMGLGYLYGWILRFPQPALRSQLFEVGICNTALAAVLASAAFGDLAGVAAMMNMMCNLTLGSLAAVLLSRVPTRSLQLDRGLAQDL